MKNIPSEILRTADETINARAKKRDVEQERSMAATVTAFNAIFGTNLTETMGWQFMTLLKMKRASTGLYDVDDYVDQAAYSALAGESKSNENNRNMIASAKPSLNMASIAPRSTNRIAPVSEAFPEVNSDT